MGKHFVGATLYWDSMDEFYADNVDFIERRWYDVSYMDNRERVAHAASMARIDATAEPLPPETPDMLRLIRMYIKGMGGLTYAKSVLRVKAELLPPPDFYADDHAPSCGCWLCVGETDEEARFESYLLHEAQYDMPSWAERYDR